MKKLLSLFLTILLLTGCAATYDGPTVAKSVLSSQESCYYHTDGTVSYRTRTEYTYDIYGNRSQILDYSHAEGGSDSEPYLKTVLCFDKSGNVTRQMQYDVSGLFQKKLTDTRYEYDDRGRRIADRHGQGLSWDNTTIVYDDEANTRTTSNNGSTIVEYLDENGWVLRAEGVFADGVPITEEFDRREDGQLLTVHRRRDGVLYAVMEMTYDDQGRPLTQTVTEDGETTVLFSWEYGEDYEKMLYADGSYSVIRFNPDGTMDEQSRFGADGSIQERITYHYTEIQVPMKEEAP